GAASGGEVFHLVVALVQQVLDPSAERKPGARPARFDQVAFARRVDSRVRRQRYTGERERREVLVRSSSDVRDRERHAATSWKAMGGAHARGVPGPPQQRLAGCERRAGRRVEAGIRDVGVEVRVGRSERQEPERETDGQLYAT